MGAEHQGPALDNKENRGVRQVATPSPCLLGGMQPKPNSLLQERQEQRAGALKPAHNPTYSFFVAGCSPAALPSIVVGEVVGGPGLGSAQSHCRGLDRVVWVLFRFRAGVWVGCGLVAGWHSR